MATTNRTHAVVLGASMAGLATARALHNHFARVTVIERDVLNSTDARKGVPQGNHAHGLLPSGYRVKLPAEKIDTFVTAQNRAADAPVVKPRAVTLRKPPGKFTVASRMKQPTKQIMARTSANGANKAQPKFKRQRLEATHKQVKLAAR